MIFDVKYQYGAISSSKNITKASEMIESTSKWSTIDSLPGGVCLTTGIIEYLYNTALWAYRIEICIGFISITGIIIIVD